MVAETPRRLGLAAQLSVIEARRERRRVSGAELSRQRRQRRPGAGSSGLRIVEVGVFEATTVQKPPADTPSGVVLLQKDVRLAQSTTEVCPRPGVLFGLRYAVEGEPQGAPVEIVVKVNFPGAGVRYPGSRKRERIRRTSLYARYRRRPVRRLYDWRLLGRASRSLELSVLVGRTADRRAGIRA